MNLKCETKNRLEYQERRIEDLKECLTHNLTDDCRHFTNEEITKAERNREYYKEILNVLEVEKNEY